jgi:hypothetical protein
LEKELVLLTLLDRLSFSIGSTEVKQAVTEAIGRDRGDDVVGEAGCDG